jgi:hypothetical protein
MEIGHAAPLIERSAFSSRPFSRARCRAGMHSVKQQVIRLIHEHQAAVFWAIVLLNAKPEQERGFQRHERSPGLRAGYLNARKQVGYVFHGASCLVTLPGLEVNFDFAKEGWCTGIDSWFLVNFLQDNPAVQAQHPLLTSREQVEQVLLELKQDGMLTRRVYSALDGRYFLTADLGNPRPPTVTCMRPTKALLHDTGCATVAIAEPGLGSSVSR